MVSPDDDVVDVLHLAASFASDLADSSRLVKSGKGGELLLWDRWSVVGGDQSVGVSWVSNNTNLDGLLSDLVDGLSLSLEDLGISAQKITSLHSWTSWSGTDQKSHVCVLEPNHGVSGWDDLVHEWVGSIHKLHAESLQGALSVGQFN